MWTLRKQLKIDFRMKHENKTLTVRPCSPNDGDGSWWYQSTSKAMVVCEDEPSLRGVKHCQYIETSL